MPKPNQKGGKNFKKGKKGTGETRAEEPKATESYQRYAQVVKKLGGNVLVVNCSDGTTRHGLIPGKMHKRVWMNPGDILLVEVIDELNKNAKIQECFITHKYSNHMANNLKSMNLISFNVKADEVEEDSIKFGEDNSKLSLYDEIYGEMDKLEEEENKNTEKKKELLTKDDKETKKRLLKENSKLKDQSRQLARKQKDDVDDGPLDIDAI